MIAEVVRSPRRTRVVLFLRLPLPLRQEILRRAQAAGLPVARWVEQAIRDYLDRTEQSRAYRWTR